MGGGGSKTNRDIEGVQEGGVENGLKMWPGKNVGCP